MRLAVTGAHGQVVTALAERGAALGLDVRAVGRPRLDLADPDSIRSALADVDADVIVNAAAYTAVDKAESEPDAAMQANRDGAGHVAACAAARGRPIVHLSTDYVFDGALQRPYCETDATNPTGTYGRSKLAGEHAVREANPAHVIVRTAWVYSPFGHNFLKTMLRLGETRAEVGVVADQIGAPTAALDIADGLIAIAQALVARANDPQLRGTFHMTGRGEASWADFATEIFARAAERGRPRVAVKRIGTRDYPTPAQRPANSRLDTTKLGRTFGIVLPPWQESVRACVDRLLADA